MKKVLSLFDGASCAQFALRKNGVKADYYASEIDEYAMKIANKNFPGTKQIGDITALRNGDLPKDIDLLVAGFPCQDLSSASNNGKGLKGERSGLFYELVRVLNAVKPRYFIIENVKPRNAADQTIITNLLGVHPIMLDSQIVSAQRRKRLYWTNIPNIKPPELVPSKIYPDNKIGLVIADILEPDAVRKVVNIAPERLIKTSYGVRWNGYEQKRKPEALCAHFTNVKNGGLVASKLRSKTNIVRGSNYGLQGNYAIESDRKHNALINSNLKQNVNIVIDHNSHTNRAISIKNKFPTIKASRPDGMNKVLINCDDVRIEQLTWLEIERLQGFPDFATDLGDDNRVEARGRAIGNGFQINIFAHILSFLAGNPEPIERSENLLIGEQRGLFASF